MSSRHDGGGGPLFNREPIDPTTLATLLDHAYDAVAVRRFEGEILFWNRGAERTFGWTAAQAIGQVSHSLLHTRFPRPLVANEETLERDGASSGLGIGLTLVRSIVELHGGSRFRVRLPRVQPATAEPKGTASTPAEAMVIKRVLIADDNVDAVESLQLWLEMAGHEVHIALTGPSALKLAETVHPEVALLDVGMPGMTGLEVAAKIREAPWGREMVLIALTGWGQEEDRRRTREAGFDHHLTKPVAPDTIEELIRRS